MANVGNAGGTISFDGAWTPEEKQSIYDGIIEWTRGRTYEFEVDGFDPQHEDSFGFNATVANTFGATWIDVLGEAFGELGDQGMRQAMERGLTFACEYTDVYPGEEIYEACCRYSVIEEEGKSVWTVEEEQHASIDWTADELRDAGFDDFADEEDAKEEEISEGIEHVRRLKLSEKRLLRAHPMDLEPDTPLSDITAFIERHLEDAGLAQFVSVAIGRIPGETNVFFVDYGPMFDFPDPEDVHWRLSPTARIDDSSPTGRRFDRTAFIRDCTLRDITFSPQLTLYIGYEEDGSLCERFVRWTDVQNRGLDDYPVCSAGVLGNDMAVVRISYALNEDDWDCMWMPVCAGFTMMVQTDPERASDYDDALMERRLFELFALPTNVYQRARSREDHAHMQAYRIPENFWNRTYTYEDYRIFGTNGYEVPTQEEMQERQEANARFMRSLYGDNS